MVERAVLAMSTITRAIELMGHFTAQSPEIGLSEMCRLSGRDKATCYRHLTALESVGLLEQNPANQKYRIGTAVLRWAAQREIAMPRRQILKTVLPQLAEATGETAHCSIVEGDRLCALMHQDSMRHSTRVVMNQTVLPFHATASGLAVLAFSAEPLVAKTLRTLDRYTPATVTDLDKIKAALGQIRADGIAVSVQAFDVGVHSLAAPLFDDTGRVAGAVAVAAMATRMTAALDATIRTALIAAAETITESWGGTLPAPLATTWAQTAATLRHTEVSA